MELILILPRALAMNPVGFLKLSRIGLIVDYSFNRAFGPGRYRCW